MFLSWVQCFCTIVPNRHVFHIFIKGVLRLYLYKLSTYIVDKHTGKVLAVEDIIQIDVWDFAGQFIFLTTHQTYLSDRCVYLLVFDMSKDLDETVDEGDVSGTSRKTVLGNGIWWTINDFPDSLMGDMASKNISSCTVSYTAIPMTTDLHLHPKLSYLQNFKRTSI